MLLNQAGYALNNRLAAALDEVGVSVRGYCVLMKAAEGEFTQGEIATRAWLDKTTMVVTVDELEQRGLAVRRPSPSDRRVRVVVPTDEGRRVLAEAVKVVRRVYRDLLADVPDARRDAFVEVLSELVEGPLAAPFHLEKRVRRRRTAA